LKDREGFFHREVYMNDKQEMPKSYSHSTVESRIYEWWENSGFFGANPNESKAPFCIVMPPPNITGQLHMGHALDNTLQDVIIRYKRMSGFETLWLPGTDHASIATEVKIVEQMAGEGLTKEQIGREAFLERAWNWRNTYGTRIVAQLRKLGSSCDWSRERFTMDEGCSKAVNQVFVSLYEKGLIYRGNRIVNWCTDCQTAISDAEVEFEEQESNLWHVRYDAPDKSYSIICATTRPETILGDTGIAVNPNDDRYKHLVGKTVLVPVINREIPIVADEYVEIEFGTGAVKITPSHDPNDFEVGIRTGLPQLCVFTPDGFVNEQGGKYKGISIKECRKVFVKDLEAAGALVKIEPYKHNVGTCYRCGTTIEPLVSKQWFIDIKPLAKRAIEAVESGEIRFVPERYAKTYFNWMNNIRDWCISRQLWWGHRIPAWHCEDCGEITVSATTPSKCKHCGSERIKQDPDVLDTWFSSGMWPFSTLGWPENTADLRCFYPTNTLVTGYDIIFFWIARMIMFGYYVMGEKPFDTVYVHGIVRDELGRKMSKSLGNGIDPLEVIEKYGADALRFSLITGNSAGNDMRFYDEKVNAASNFCNKVYNATRFVLMNLGDEKIEEIDLNKLDIADKWILHRLNEVIRDVTNHLDSYDLNLAAERIYDFIWSEFCDWYIEMAKPRLYGENAEGKATAKSVLVYVLDKSFKLLHPFMPFITEELYQHLPNSEETIMRSEFPKARAEFDFPNEANAFNAIMDLVRSIRNVRKETNCPPAKRISIDLVYFDKKDEEYLKQASAYFTKLAGAENVWLFADKSQIPENAVSAISSIAEAFIPMGELVDAEKETERVSKELEKIQAEINRFESKLNNPGFVSKAPKAVVDEERAKLQSAKNIESKLLERLEQLKKL
jgi:valyl-tRNA synthetase